MDICLTDLSGRRSRGDVVTTTAELHDLNREFHWTPTTGPFRVVSDEQARAYDEVGFFVLEDALAPDLVERLIAEIDPFEAEMEAIVREADGGQVFIAKADRLTFTVHLTQRSPELRRFAGSQLFADLCADLMGPDVRFYWDQAVYKKPSPDATFPWHQDNGYAFIEPQQYLTCWIPLTDATEDNGCPIVVPGLHRRGTLAHRLTRDGFVCLDDPDDTIAVPARAGSIVVFSSLTPHCTLPNTTDAVRKSYIVQYAVDPSVILREGEDGNVDHVSVDDPDRRFPLLRDGVRVS
jgi:ectoine hydroxylase-related dioxygenase (phytanoyl-CoA dioxygenase family)